ncbi:OmpH family outer membrane protein [Flavihumibacter profundi]|jgi:outer membrane protein|uniref:OmpH family outer membrane protein n=1 Tax=Flavihumibacter profundi TaxID=2716883 RepID=UPI001CC826CD|nr:OmpH family outer membrane protein [Flavihumibacter profundi]MBZ5857878.1 OmpH family outer membrane protein [Flavihumibacter profundi]
MKKVLSILMVAVALVMVSSTVKAQMKIGYISFNEVVAGMPEAKKADSTLAQFRDALIANAQEKETALNEGIAKFNTDSTKMTPAVKDVKRKELQQKLTELQGEEQRIQQELQKKQEELSAPIQKKAMDAVTAVAKESGYTHVFPKEYLIVSPPADDLLPLVKKKLGIK